MKIKVLIGVLLCANMLWAGNQDQPIRVGLLLTLQQDIVKRDKSVDRFLDFYTGALMAVYETQAKGQRVEVYTYDIDKSVRQLEQVLEQPCLDSMDMIIGPTYPQQVRVMAQWAARHCVLTLVPFVYDVPELKTNPWLMQFNPSEQMEASVMVKELVREGRDMQFVFVEADEALVPDGVKALQQSVKAENIPYVYTTIQQIMHDSLGMVLSDEKENILVMNTERYANLRQTMPYLERAAQGKTLIMVTRYAWQDEPIILPQIYTTVFRKDVDIQQTGYDSLYRRFVKKERMITRPNYDLLGYDLMSYALQTMEILRDATDTRSREAILTRKFKGLQSDIHFVKISDGGGYLNNKIHVVSTK